MALTERDKQFVANLKADGKTQQEAFTALKAIKQKMAFEEASTIEKTQMIADNSEMFNQLMADKPAIAQAITTAVGAMKWQEEEVARKKETLSQTSPSVSAALSTAEQYAPEQYEKSGVEQKLIENEPDFRLGDVIDRKLDETIGQIPYIGGVLSAGMSMTTKPMTYGIDVGLETIDTAKEGLSTAYEGVDQIMEAVTSDDVNARDRFLTGMSGLADVIQGGLTTGFSPVTSMISEAPVVGDVAEAGFEKYGGVMDKWSEEFGKGLEIMGVDVTPQQQEVLDKWFQILGQGLIMKGGETVVKSPTTKAAIEKGGEIAVKGKEIIKPKVETGVEALKQAGQKTGEIVQTTGQAITGAGKAVGRAIGKGTEAVTSQFKKPVEVLDTKAKFIPEPTSGTLEGLAAKKISPVPEADVTGVMKNVNDIAKGVNEKLGKTYEEGSAKIVEQYGSKKFPQVMSTIKNQMTTILDEYGITRKPIKEGKGFDFENSSFADVTEVKTIEKLIQQIENTKNPTAEQLNTLRQRLNQFNQKAQRMGGPISSLAQRLYSVTREAIGNEIPEWKALNEKYSQGKQVLDDASKFIETDSETAFLNLTGKGKVGAKQSLLALEQLAEELGVEAKGKTVEAATETIKATEQAKIQQALTKEQIKNASKAVNITTKEFNALLKDAANGKPPAIQRLIGYIRENKFESAVVTYILYKAFGIAVPSVDTY